MQIDGFMNFLSFDSKGYPSQAIYDVINYQGNKLVKVTAGYYNAFYFRLTLNNSLDR